MGREKVDITHLIRNRVFSWKKCHRWAASTRSSSWWEMSYRFLLFFIQQTNTFSLPSQRRRQGTQIDCLSHSKAEGVMKNEMRRVWLWATCEAPSELLLASGKNLRMGNKAPSRCNSFNIPISAKQCARIPRCLPWGVHSQHPAYKLIWLIRGHHDRKHVGRLQDWLLQ